MRRKKPRRIVFGIIIAVFFAFVFGSIVWDFSKPKDISPRLKRCILAITDPLFLAKGEEFLIQDFDPETWEVDFSPEGIAKITNNRIIALEKGESEVVFHNKEQKSCVLNIKLGVANVASQSAQTSLGENQKIDLSNLPNSTDVPLIPPQ